VGLDHVSHGDRAQTFELAAFQALCHRRGPHLREIGKFVTSS